MKQANIDFEIFENIKREKVLIMLSGGKDSAACLHLLNSHEINVTAIHFQHKWGYSIVTNEAKRICGEYNIPLTVYDYSKEFKNSIKGFKGGRPCLLCKEKMYEITLAFALKNNIRYICIGDNANDTSTIARIQKHISKNKNETIILNSFLDSKIVLPKSIKIIRPIINLSSDEVFQYLKKNNIDITRVGDTGDKYFEYSREGCPIQFHDPGVPITVNNMVKLHKYNTILSEFARSNSIRASIHMPSEFIVTIPKGYEKKARVYLLEKGIALKNVANENKTKKYLYTITITKIRTEIFQDDVLEFLINRLFFRLNENLTIINSFISCLSNVYVYESDTATSSIHTLNRDHVLNIFLVSNKNHQTDYIENLLIEVFRTTNFSVYIKEI